jgi:hypothetical protein
MIVAESLVQEDYNDVYGWRIFEVHAVGDESSRTMTSGGKRCAVERAMRGACFICQGGARH